MELTRVYFDGGTRDGLTHDYDLAAEADVLDLENGALGPREVYQRTMESRTVNGRECVVFRLAA
jgi:hypothetical protein